jgi:hypothetical protein
MPADPPRPPKGLPAEVRHWWAAIVAGWELEQAALAMLRTAAEAYAGELQALADIRQRGQLVGGKVNPSVRVARDMALVKLRAIKALNLDLEPLRDKAGRPPGPRPMLRRAGHAE